LISLLDNSKVFVLAKAVIEINNVADKESGKEKKRWCIRIPF